MRWKILLIILTMVVTSYGQELNCMVTVNSEKIEGSNKQVFNTLQKSIQDFVNTTHWTTYTYTSTERIDCSMLIVVNSVENDIYSCELTLQSKRPVYNTNYTTPVLNYKDDYFTFKYMEYDRLEYQPTGFENNLSALIAYYCMFIIGFDMDTYSRLGGTNCFQQCENIVSSAQSAPFEASELTGWKAFGSNKNRYAIVNNLMDNAFSSLREFIYDYHRMGLDMMAQNMENARAKIVEQMPVLKETYRSRQNTYLVNIFLEAKHEEIVNIVKKGSTMEKQTVYDVLTFLDPTRQKEYSVLR